MKKLNLRLGTAILAIAAVLPSQAVIWRNDNTDAMHLAYGLNAKFSGVGMISNTTTGKYGTASYIGNNGTTGWFLTADHVITNGQNGNFTFTRTGEPGGTWATTAVHQIGTNDIAIFSVANFNETVTRIGIGGTATVGESIYSAGVGKSGAEGAAQVSDQKKRGFDTKLDGLVATGNYTFTGANMTYNGALINDRFDNPGPPDPNVTALEGFGAAGDSGSAYVDVLGCALGVLSHGPPEVYGAINKYARIDNAARDRIWELSGVPEPTSMVAIGIGLAALAAKRRKRN